jgi:DNA-binding transcriptional ArsR family regulator
MVILVVLALGLSTATPAVAGPHDDGTLGGGLDGSPTDSTSSDGDLLSDDSTDGSGESGTSDDGSDSGDDPESRDGSDDAEPTDRAVASLVEPVADVRGVDIGTARSSEVLDGDGASEPGLVDMDETDGSDGTPTGYEIELVELPATTDPFLAVVATGDATDGATATVASLSRTYDTMAGDLAGGPSGVTDASTRTAQARVVAGPAAVEPRADGADGAVDGGDGGDGPADPAVLGALGVRVPTGEMPGGPAGGGAALGGLGLAAAAIARQTGAFGGLSAGLADTTGTAATAVPGSSRSGRLVRLLAPLRYSRYDASDPLEHETRDAMLEVIEESPGTYLSAVADRVEVPPSTARHHVRVLEREDLISGAKVRGKRRFYPAHMEGVELAAAMNDDATAAVVDALARVGAASVSDLADELGKDPSTVTHHVQRLEEDEVVVRERDGRAVMNRLSAAVRTAMEPAEPTAEEPPAGEAMASD